VREVIVVRSILLSLLVLGCGADVPANPTWFTDVQPIVRANCARCHGADPSDPKIAKFRLDRYVKDDTATFDAYDYAISTGGNSAPMVSVAVDQQAPAMPPDYSLSDRQKEILARWSEQGAPKGTRANRAPQIELIAPTDITSADQSLDLTVRSWDDDLDGLVVRLWAHDLATVGEDADIHLGSSIGGGNRDVTVDTGQLASKHMFEVYAILDDGFFDDPTQNRTHATVIPSLDLDHGARGTAPTVTVVAPNGGETLIGSAPITWTATDPDVGDTVTIDLALMLVAADGTETVAMMIASGIANTGSYTWMIPTSLDPAAAYRIRVTGTDTLGVPQNVRSDESDGTFSVAIATTTTYAWTDVAPIFKTYCSKCHSDPAKTAAIDYFCLLKYSADPADQVTGCAATDEGVYEVKGLVYQRMVSAKTMPPATEPKPPQSDIDKVGNWIQGGAPKGSGGPTNNPPTFAWTAPSGTQSSGTTATLTWTATDVEGLASGKLEYAHLNGIPSTGCGSIMTATWTQIADPKATATLAGALSWSDTFSWTIPNPTGAGYYCVRGSVTDTGGTTTTTVNAYGIK